MSGLLVEGLCRAHGGRMVLDGAELVVPAGAIVALLGASGCGKTSLLRLIAGFDGAQAGRIVLGGRVLQGPRTHVPAERRGIGYVPQEGTLFPHLTVAGNVGFGLARGQRRARVAEALALTGLEGLGERRPDQLSGGQQQRTALARALAPRPGLILLDEPFNALDLALRRHVCADVVGVLRAQAATAILVTHDPQEAFASADLVAVMQGGRIAQLADPATVYARPVDAGVARLTGPAVLLDATPCAEGVDTVLGRLAVQGCPRVGTAMLRPEQIVVVAPGQGVAARVLHSSFAGDHTLVSVDVAGVAIDIRAGPQAPSGVIDLAVRGACLVF